MGGDEEDIANKSDAAVEEEEAIVVSVHSRTRLFTGKETHTVLACCIYHSDSRRRWWPSSQIHKVAKSQLVSVASGPVEELLTTVRSCDRAAEYPIAAMMDGKNRENEYTGVTIPRYVL